VSTAGLTGVILAGGLATRYGGLPKGLERVGGHRIIDRVAGSLSAVADDLLLVANDDAAEGWLPGVRRVRDRLVGLGALGGIHSALAHTTTPVLIVAWDMPFVPASLLRELVWLSGDVDVVVPESGSSRHGVEPLCAWYAHACLAAIERRIAVDDRRVVGFFDDVRVARLPAERVSQHGDPARLFLNVNTPDDHALAETHAATLLAHAADGGGDRQEA
jgi:molybdopterin-guanine dinucleotide biosynthesis protein A